MMKVLVVLMLVCAGYAKENKTLSDTQDVHAALRELTASLAETKVEVKNLRAENKGKQVAFSASLVATGGQLFGPFNRNTPLVYKHVVTNIGNAYNSHTGAFTAPLKGAYHFEWHIYGDGGRPIGAVLVKNSERIFLSFEVQASGFATASNGVTLLLEAGDSVSVLLWPDSTVLDNENRHTTFSGHLIFTV